MSKTINIGPVKIGGGSKIAIQSMLNREAHDIEGNIEQALQLQNAGCDIVRIAVPDMDSVKTLHAVKDKISIPLVADIHFDYRLAIESAAAGADKIRINPGNIGSADRVKAVVAACREKNLPIRIGVNSGSLEKSILAKYGGATPEGMVDSALYNVSLLEKFDFDDIVISLKSSDVKTMVSAYRLMSGKCSYPLHIGVTEAGSERMGIIKSAAGIGALLVDGIGDTIRVSLTADPVKEIFAAKDILKSLGYKGYGVNIVSCPTCGRTRIDLIALANAASEALRNVDKDITVAIMGCVVNGPGEASAADIGIAGGIDSGLIFKKGAALRKVPQGKLLEELISEIEKM
ncbi:MAG: flavodoxin-dependent (E)-4-hydroxy-3-methylbut-2-enyl-diphosphate synthase [Clostridia bacterium]|nr:flavodoxin-dependent (E)-4-hydroxy-3-methylbut-2-enyl-diphosphate synthase [Clostridia bacterium]